ncbi:MAG: hypothetical protein AAFX80_10880 [Cyanobacteria bacterium J06639_18]
MLRLVQDLVEKLNHQKIIYCHWKSNTSIQDALSGIGDLDLLVNREDVQKFEGTLAYLGFKRVIDPLQVNCPSIFHFYGLDRDTGILVHLHVYYRVITGESLLKNYCLPLEKIILKESEILKDIPVPSKAAELIVFVLRMMVKHTSILEYMLLLRSGEDLRKELKFLLTDESVKKFPIILENNLPSVDIKLFNQCLECIQNKSPLLRHFWLSIKLRRQLKNFNRLSFTSEWLLRAKLFIQRILWRFLASGKSKKLVSGGAVIAFVGAEATGKSTLVKETRSWLGKVFHVSSVHLGKPPSTWLSFLPNLTLPIFRRISARDRMSSVIVDSSTKEKNISLLYAIRSILVAWDRYQLATKIRRQVANGKLVICDRYPSTIVGAMDSARLNTPEKKGWKNNILRYLAKLENQIYRQIPPPDLVIQLNVPVDVAMKRNQSRDKEEPSDYVLCRHTKGMIPSFPMSKTILIDSNQSIPETISCVRQSLWDAI